MLNLILTTASDPTWIDSISGFVQNYVLPIANTLIITVGPIVTPYISSRISTKFNNITALIKNSILDVQTKVSAEVSTLEKKVDVLSSIPAQFGAMLAPVFAKQDELLDILMIVADNSRIPDEVKKSIKNLHDTNMATANSANEYLAGQQKKIDDLQSELKALAAALAKQAEESAKAVITTKKTQKRGW